MPLSRLPKSSRSNPAQPGRRRRMFSPKQGTSAIFFDACELLHIYPYESAACCSSPDGVSRFQYPGLARSLTVYYVDGLVFCALPLIAPRSAAKIAAFARQRLCKEHPTMSAEPLLTSDVIGLTKVAPFSRRGFMTATAAVTAGYTLAAGPGARRRHQDRHQRPHRRRRQDQGGRRRDARLFRPPRGRRQSAGRAGGDGDFRPARIHQGRDAAARQARRARGGAGLLFPQGHRPHQDHRHPAAVADREFETGRRAVVRSRLPRWPGPSRRAATPQSSASSASAAAAARSGNMPPTAPR